MARNENLAALFERDLHAIPASQFSIDPGIWGEVLSCLSDDLIFTFKPRFSAIPLQGHLVQVRHQSVKSRSDLQNCALSGKRIWVRGRDSNTSKKKPLDIFQFQEV